jgi:hypothetical protein
MGPHGPERQAGTVTGPARASFGSRSVYRQRRSSQRRMPRSFGRTLYWPASSNGSIGR